MLRPRAGAPALIRIGAVGGIASMLVFACATGSERVDQSEDDNITETTSTGGGGGMGGTLITSTTTTTTGSGGNGGTGGEDLNCSESPCKVTAPQCGCPTGEKCTLMPSIYTRDCRTAGSAVHGEVCTSDLDCAAGTYCMNLAGHRVCRDYCEQDSDCVASGGGLCRVALGLNPGTEKWCADSCDPISNAGCTVAGSKCELVLDSTDTWYTICVAEGTGTQGSSCANDCAAGYGCTTIGPDTQCRQWCDVASPACGNCVAFSDPKPVIGGTEYGACN